MGTRDAILEAADQLFGEIGYEAASTRRIGELSGVNKALIHYHFKDKDQLWSSVLERYYARLGLALRSVLDRPGTLRGRLVDLVGVYLDFLADNRTFARMVQREVSGGRHVQQITAQMVPLFEIGAELLRQAYPETREGPLAAAQLLVSFYGMAVSWVTYAPVVEGLIGGDPLGAEQLAMRKAHLAEMVDLVIGALQTRRAAAGSETSPRRQS